MSIDDFETSPHMRPTPGGDAMYRAGLTVGRREGQVEIARLTQERDASREAERLASAEWLRLRAENEKMKAVYEEAIRWYRDKGCDAATFSLMHAIEHCEDGL